jgi:uncharacterized protein YukE
MGAIADVMMLEDQQKLDREAAQASAGTPGGPVAKADDFHMPQLPFLMPPLPESTFPKGLKAGGQFSVYPDQLTAVRGAMVGGSELGELTNALNNLISYGAFGAGIGGWDTAGAFGSNAENAYQAITQFMQALNKAYDMVAGAVGKAAQNYGDADATTASAASQVSSEAAPGGLAG